MRYDFRLLTSSECEASVTEAESSSAGCSALTRIQLRYECHTVDDLM